MPKKPPHGSFGRSWHECDECAPPIGGMRRGLLTCSRVFGPSIN
jgi:hypothetical protein